MTENGRPAFEPARFLSNPHLQTLWRYLIPVGETIGTRVEILELPDGDFLELHWALANGIAVDAPIVLLFHGLEGSAASRSAKGMLRAFAEAGFRGVVMQFRNCGDRRNRLPRSYHAGDTGDVEFTIETLLERFPDTPIAAVGYSLGGNMLLKWLGETGDTRLTTAVAISVPFDLSRAAQRVERGFSLFYNKFFLRQMKARQRSKSSEVTNPVDLHRMQKAKTLREFDDRVTAPLHGFRNSHHYYEESSSRPHLSGIKLPTLIIHAEDDPFMYPDSVPTEAELSESTTLELYTKGGHLGFIVGDNPLKPRYWLEERLPQYLKQAFDGLS